MTYLGRDAVLHALVGMQLIDTSWLGRIFTTCNGQDAVFRHALVWKQFNDMPGRRHFTGCRTFCPGDVLD